MKVSVDKVFTDALKYFKVIQDIGEQKLGIEEKHIHIYFESLQNSVTVPGRYLGEFSKYFDEINFSFFEEDNE